MVNKYLSLSQSGFRKGRSTSDAVFAHRWMVAKSMHFRNQETHILGIDLSKAFDTINRAKLFKVLQTFIPDDEVKIIRLLLTDTSLSVIHGTSEQDPFQTNIGSPQGDSLSPILFNIYLEAALRDLWKKLPEVPFETLLQIIYADDCDFIGDPQHLQLIQDRAPAILKEWSLFMNPDKTEHTTILRSTDPNVEKDWRHVRKLGSLLGDREDVSKRKQLAGVAFHKMWRLWFRDHLVPEDIRLKLYNAMVLPILLYNCGTWGLTAKDVEQLDSFHRKQLRCILRMHYPHKISNAQLYKRTNSEPIRYTLVKRRWSLLGHILRLPPGVPANVTMKEYYILYNNKRKHKRFRGPRRTSLPTVLKADLEKLNDSSYQLKKLSDLEKLRCIAADKSKWRNLRDRVVTAAKQQATTK